MTGLSGPKVRPHVVLHFGLRGAYVRWPDPARRINHWDLQGTLTTARRTGPKRCL
ncbi:MAG: hypothetical protein WKG07_31825 [Hymenobacter sp.]